MIQGVNIKGWNFKLNPEKKFSMEGSSTRESLNVKLEKLKARLNQIPVLLSQTQQSISVMTQDLNWLRSLSDRKRKKWEKENGKGAGDAIRELESKINSRSASLTTLKNEQSRLPKEIETVQNQIDKLVEGESKGLEKGLDAQSARQLGELEVEKKQQDMAHEQQLRQAEIENQAQLKSGGVQTKWILITAIAAVVVISGIIFIRNRSKKAAISAPVAGELKPLST